MTVPVFVDSVKRNEGFEMTRCSYFEVSAEDPQPGWRLGLQDGGVEFLLLGMSGIIMSPVGGGIFQAPDQIDALYEALDRAGLSIRTGSIFVPNALCPAHQVEFYGSVLRVDIKIFSMAYHHKSGDLAGADYEMRCRELPQSVTLSPEETEVFRLWHINEVAALREQFPKNDALMLGWKERLDR